MTNKQKGILCAILGPVLWGVSGNVAEYLFDQPGIRPDWLVAVRMLGAGTLLMAISLATKRPQLVALTHDSSAWVHSMLFGLCGVFVSQFTYFSAVAASNAPTTTVLQALGPVLIILYLALRNRQWPPRLDVLCVVIAFAGIILLVTHGHLGSLALTPQGLFWGIGAGVGAALYTLMPGQLLTHYSTDLVLARGDAGGGYRQCAGAVPAALASADPTGRGGHRVCDHRWDVVGLSALCLQPALPAADDGGDARRV